MMRISTLTHHFGTAIVKSRNGSPVDSRQVSRALQGYRYADQVTVMQSQQNANDVCVRNHKRFNHTVEQWLRSTLPSRDLTVHTLWCRHWSPEQIADYIQRNPPESAVR